MKREDLEKLGLTAEQIDAVMKINGSDIEKHKTASETVKAELDAVKAQLGEANAAIEGFKKLDVDGIKKAADDWKAKAEQAETAAQQQVSQMKFEHALDGALSGAKARNTAAVKALLKLNDLKLGDDGKIIGLDDQLKSIREANDFLFEADGDNPPPKIVAGGQNPPNKNDPLWTAMLKGAGLTESKS